MRLYPVCESGTDWDSFSVIGAENSLEAVKAKAAWYKAEQVEEIAYGKRRYAELVSEGRLDPINDPWEHSGFQTSFTMPDAWQVVPMEDVANYRSWAVTSDRKYQSQAFDALWNWDAMQVVRL